MKGAVALSSWLRDPSKYPTPFNAGNGVETDIFQWFEVEEARARRFHEAMDGSSEIYPASIFVNGTWMAKAMQTGTHATPQASIGAV